MGVRSINACPEEAAFDPGFRWKCWASRDLMRAADGGHRMSQAALRWSGDVASVAALLALRARGEAPALVASLDARTQRDERTGVPGFVLEEQAACLGATLRPASMGEPSMRPPDLHDDQATARALGLRAFVCACRPPADQDVLGRFLEDVGPESISCCATLVVDGPPFRRRVDVAAGDPFPFRGGWALDLSLRGC